jgi:hypothetical protein
MVKIINNMYNYALPMRHAFQHVISLTQCKSLQCEDVNQAYAHFSITWFHLFNENVTDNIKSDAIYRSTIKFDEGMLDDRRC